MGAEEEILCDGETIVEVKIEEPSLPPNENGNDHHAESFAPHVVEAFMPNTNSGEDFLPVIEEGAKRPSGSEELQPCLICGDRSSGRHYGVLACDGCRGFFKRSVRRNSTYLCRENMKCVVDLKRRNQCQFCRLRKCYLVGMRREAVQNQRPPRGSTSKPSKDPPSQVVVKPYARVVEFPPANQQQQVTPPTLPPPPQHKIAPSAPRTTPPLTPPNTPKVKDSKFKITSAEELFDVSAHILYETVTWTKKIPTFMELPPADQALLLEHAWSELFLLSMAQWNVPLDIDHLLQIGGREHEKRAVDQLVRLQSIVRKMQSLHLDTMEFSCVNALVVFKPDVADLKCRSTVEHLQEQAQVTLSDYCSNRSKVRFGKILLKLPLVKEIPSSLVKRYFLKGDLDVMAQLNVSPSTTVYHHRSPTVDHHDRHFEQVPTHQPRVRWLPYNQQESGTNGRHSPKEARYPPAVGYEVRHYPHPHEGRNHSNETVYHLNDSRHHHDIRNHHPSDSRHHSSEARHHPSEGVHHMSEHALLHHHPMAFHEQHRPAHAHHHERNHRNYRDDKIEPRFHANLPQNEARISPPRTYRTAEFPLKESTGAHESYAHESQQSRKEARKRKRSSPMQYKHLERRGELYEDNSDVKSPREDEVFDKNPESPEQEQKGEQVYVVEKPSEESASPTVEEQITIFQNEKGEIVVNKTADKNEEEKIESESIKKEETE